MPAIGVLFPFVFLLLFLVFSLTDTISIGMHIDGGKLFAVKLSLRLHAAIILLSKEQKV